jgi:hypothetical protein
VVIRNGRITVAWVEGDPGVDLRVVVRSLDGNNQWSAVGNGGGPAPNPATTEIERPRLVVTGTAPMQSLALVWSEDFQFLRVVELVGDDWVATATAPYPTAAGPFDMMWTPDLGLVVAAVAGGSVNIQVRHWLQGQWADLGAPRGDTDRLSFVIDLAFSHGPADATPLLAQALSRSRGAVNETLAERFVGGNWLQLGDELPAVDRFGGSASPHAVAVADHAQPAVAVVLQGELPGTATTDHTLAVYHFDPGRGVLRQSGPFAR